MTPLSATTSAVPHPDHVGRFKILRLLGTGSMGAVFLAEDPVIHREVAIKTLNVNMPASEARLFEDTFLNEARAAGRLNHPHIVTVYDAGRIDGKSYIAMEYLKGVELKELIGRGERFSIKQSIEIFVRVADALQYAHEHGIVHRDIKPANIFMTGKTNPKVLDFGIAQAVTSFTGSFIGGQLNENIMGTPNYMSPELIQGKPLDGRSDVFSLGVVMYEVLTHTVPFQGRTFEELTRQIVEAHPRPPQDVNPDVPLEIARIVGKALAKAPEERYQTAKDLAADLRRWMAGQRVKQIISANVKVEPPEPTVEPARTTPARRSIGAPLWLAGGVLALVLAFAIGVSWDKSRSARAAAAVDATPPEAATSTPPSSAAPDAPRVDVAPASTAPVASDDAAPERARPASAATATPAASSESASKPRPAKRASRAKDTPGDFAPHVPNGTLTLAVSPWGEVLVDGVSRGLSPPVSTLSLPPGHHTVEVRNGDAPPQAAQVDIRPEETSRVRFKF